MARAKLLLFLISVWLTNESALCCNCDRFTYFEWYYGSSTNISLVDTTYLYVWAYRVYHCQEIYVEWEIVRADGEIEMYNATLQEDSYYIESYLEKGLSFDTYCLRSCDITLSLSPTDLRYNGAQFTCKFSLPECGIISVTGPITVNIQGLLEAPTDMTVEADSRENIRVSWRPPFTLDDVPILHYSVYVASQGVSEQINTTETNVTLRRPCASTIYHISAWNGVGEGNTTSNELIMYDATIIKSAETQEFCFTCSFLISPLEYCINKFAEGCSLKLQNGIHTFVFNITRHDDNSLVLLECFSVEEAGEYIAHIYEIQNGDIMEYTSQQLDSIVISESPSLIGADVVSVAGGICGSCQFTIDSTAEGCAIKLYNDEHTYHFNVSYQTPRDTSLLKCFEVSTPGLFHVEVREAPDEESKDNILKLPDVVISHKLVEILSNETTATAQDNTSAVTGVSVVLGITIFGVTLAVCVLIISHVKRKLHKTSHTFTKQGSEASETSATVTANPTYYENVEIQRPTVTAGGEDNMYEQVELRPITTQQKEIEVAPNAAYVTVQR